MKTVVAVSLLSIVFAGCKKEERADNSATRYAASLQQDVSKAQAAADKANAAVAEQNARMKEAAAQAN